MINEVYDRSHHLFAILQMSKRSQRQFARDSGQRLASELK